MTKSNTMRTVLAWLIIGGVFTIGAAVGARAAKSKLSGEELWAANCSRCHNPRMAEEFSDEDWEVIMQHMRSTAGLTGEEADRIKKYLQDNN